MDPLHRNGRTMDAVAGVRSYRHSNLGGKFKMRAHALLPSYVTQDTTRDCGSKRPEESCECGPAASVLSRQR